LRRCHEGEPLVHAARSDGSERDGHGGEIGRGYYYRRGDAADMALNANTLLRRLGVQPHSDLVEAGSRWLESLRGYDAFVKLDLLYVENRFGCWAAPQRFTNTTSAYSFTPFNYRPLVHSFMRLPHYYRWRDRLPRDLMRLPGPSCDVCRSIATRMAGAA
jgi:hypothetical protein